VFLLQQQTRDLDADDRFLRTPPNCKLNTIDHTTIYTTYILLHKKYNEYDRKNLPYHQNKYIIQHTKILKNIFEPDDIKRQPYYAIHKSCVSKINHGQILLGIQVLSISFMLSRNKKIEYYIRIKIHKLIVLRFWVENDVNFLND